MRKGFLVAGLMVMSNIAALCWAGDANRAAAWRNPDSRDPYPAGPVYGEPGANVRAGYAYGNPSTYPVAPIRNRDRGADYYRDRNDRYRDAYSYRDDRDRYRYEPYSQYRSTRSPGRSAAIVGGSAAAGAAIGAMAGGGKGAAIGALLGGAGGLIYDRATRHDVDPY